MSNNSNSSNSSSSSQTTSQGTNVKPAPPEIRSILENFSIQSDSKNN